MEAPKWEMGGANCHYFPLRGEWEETNSLRSIVTLVIDSAEELGGPPRHALILLAFKSTFVHEETLKMTTGHLFTVKKFENV